jgi:hypothetical protein
MNELIKHGYNNTFDTFDTYTKEINEYVICISKHKSETKWTCTLIKWYEGDVDSNEININEDCTLEWVLELDKLLTL